MNDMIQHKGFWWPADDSHCHAVIHDEVGDVDRAVALCRGRDLAVQAGGNVGVWAAHLARMFGAVWTFEPDAANYACLLRNVPENVRAMNVGLSDRAGRAGMKRVDGNAGAHWIGPGSDVSLVALDSLDLPACDLLVLDVEGHEPHALHGAVRTIRKFRPVIMMEEKGLSEKLFGIKWGAAERWLVREHGYRIVQRIRADVILAPK